MGTVQYQALAPRAELVHAENRQCSCARSVSTNCVYKGAICLLSGVFGVKLLSALICFWIPCARVFVPYRVLFLLEATGLVVDSGT